MMALAKTIKLLYGTTDNSDGTHTYETARRFYHAIAEKYGDTVRQTIVTDDGETFIAVTDCGWWRLDFISWCIGRVGTKTYVMRMRDFDDEELEQDYRRLLDRDCP